MEVAHVRREYEALAERNRGLVEKLARWTKRILGGISMVLLVLGMVAAVAASEASHSGMQAREVAHRAAALAKANHYLAVRIQDSRRRLILEGCYQKNAQHVTAKAAITLLAERTASPTAPRLSKVRQAELIELFVDAFAPHYNCTTLLEKAGFPAPPKRRMRTIAERNSAFGPEPH